MIKNPFLYLSFCIIFIGACTDKPDKSHPEKLTRRQFTNDTIESKIAKLLADMSLSEKFGQLNQRGTSSRDNTELNNELKESVRQGSIGSFLNVMNKDHVRELQRIAVEESPHGIPLLFGRDVVHGFKTIFPIPLGQAASWDPALAEEGARIAAKEARTYGVNWTFAPMMDVTRDPRWGRIAETFGEDPYLTSRMAVAMINGFQGDFTGDNLAACAKHFAAYGAAEGGRDYNTAQVPENLLREIYLTPFHASSEAGVASIMTSFNDINGVPATGNTWLLQDILRDEWQFDGMVLSDWHSVVEMIPHGYTANKKGAARKAFTAGVNMEMMSTAYEENLPELMDEGLITMEQLDDLVTEILRVKFRMGLFEDPYFDPDEQNIILADAHKETARKAARESMVLLKNDNNVLPLSSGQQITLTGPLADAPHEQLGTWTFDGDKEDAITPYNALKNQLGDRLRYHPGLTHSRDKSEDSFNEVLEMAKKSDVIVFCGGEEAILSGEAHSRADITLPGKQEKLIKTLKEKTGKPVVLVVMAGRPIVLSQLIDHVDAVLVAWHPGTMAGPALTDLLVGKESPSGRLPVTWPKSVGQIPIYYNHYNTGRPPDPDTYVQMDSIPIEAWQSSLGNTSHYLDLGYKPHFPFGYGLSYSQVEYDRLEISKQSMGLQDSLKITASVRNTGNREMKEVVQLYVRDLVASRVRPVRELKGFQKITLQPGTNKTVSFWLHASDLAHYNQDMEKVTEPGMFHVWIAPNAAEGIMGQFEVTE